MPPPPARRGDTASPQAYHEFGVRGRKTGAVLRDRGVRDSQGMQPLDDIFSSPQDGATTAPIDDDSGSDAMDVETSPGPGPQTILREQRQKHISIPKGRSPAKTNLKSPARRNPNLQHISSPARGSPLRNDNNNITATKRKLDFTAASNQMKPPPKPSPRAATGAARFAVDIDDNLIDPDLGNGDDINVMAENSYALVDSMATDPAEPASEGWPARSRNTPMSAKARGKQRASPSLSEVRSTHHFERDLDDPTDSGFPTSYPRSDDNDNNWDDAPLPSPKPLSQRQRPSSVQRTTAGLGNRQPATLPNILEEEDESRPTKKARAEEPAPPVKRGRGRPRKNENRPPAPVKTEGKRGRGRPRKKPADENDDTGDASFMSLQRGPPMPKSRGLFSVRDTNGVQQTRSGRHSYKPVEYWRGEGIVSHEEEQEDMFNKEFGFVMPTTKEVVRVPLDAAPSKRAPGSKTRTGAKMKHRDAAEEDEELEPWELNPGTIEGNIVIWEDAHEENPPGEDDPIYMAEQRIAVSADAIQTSEVKDASFRFAKTMSMPFMGAGVVDLPPGTEKRNKNSRKMQMVFFVHFGKVLVTVNEAEFRISAGGMWFVPRGNYYSITNDYDSPCRVFFAQANEVRSSPTEEYSQLQ